MTVTALIVLISFGCGWLLTSAEPATSAVPSPKPERPLSRTVPGSAPVSQREPSPGGPLAPASSTAPITLQQLLGVSGRIAALRATLDELSPSEEPWPDEAPDALQPQAFEALLAGVIEEMGIGALEELDCSEYPCVATLAAYDDEVNPADPQDLMDLMDLRAALEERMGMPIDAHINTSPHGSWLTLGAHPDEISGPRLSQRLETAWTNAAL